MSLLGYDSSFLTISVLNILKIHFQYDAFSVFCFCFCFLLKMSGPREVNSECLSGKKNNKTNTFDRTRSRHLCSSCRFDTCGLGGRRYLLCDYKYGKLSLICSEYIKKQIIHLKLCRYYDCMLLVVGRESGNNR